MNQERDEMLKDLNAIVQYRGVYENSPLVWTTMAAFDVETKAESYCAECSISNCTHWEYRWLLLPSVDRYLRSA